MSENSLLKKIATMFLSNNKKILDGTDEKIKASEKRQNNNIGVLFAKIDDSQTDTIESLSEVMNNGYNHHDQRIKRIENELDLPPLKLK